MPNCYVRMDVAHFIKSWANFLSKNVRPRIKIFYLAAIGALIVERELSTIRAIIKSIFIISQSETIGERTPTLNRSEQLINKLISEIDIEPNSIQKLVKDVCQTTPDDANADENADEDADVNADDVDEYENNSENFWRDMADDLYSISIETVKKEEGEKDNPRYCPNVASHLKKKIETIPLWGNACRIDFGYGRVPASSAHIEGEFNVVKTHILNKKTVRVDMLVQQLIEQDKGRLAIISAQQPKIIDPEQAAELVTRSSSLDSGESLSTSGKEIDCDTQRLCSGEQIIRNAMQTEENWKGLGSKRKNAARYLGECKQKIADRLKFGSIDKIPMLKNGHLSGLEFLKIGRSKVSLSNTCAFDSIFQILLSAATDNIEVAQYIEQCSTENDIYNIVSYVAKMKRINYKAYEMRAAAIIKALDIKLTAGIQEVDATINIAHLFNQLFIKQSSIVKNCDICGHQIEIRSSLLDDEQIYTDKFPSEAVALMANIPSMCRHCKGENWTVLTPGKNLNYFYFKLYYIRHDILFNTLVYNIYSYIFTLVICFY